MALGGNALSQKGEAMTRAELIGHIREVAPQLARIAAGHELILTHGNGPQIGFLALLHGSDSAAATYTLDFLSAEAAGQIGYAIAHEIGNVDPDLESVVLLNEVIVAGDDPAFQTPTKEIGPIYKSESEAQPARDRGWHLKSVPGGWRRVVGSPLPLEVMGVDAVERQVASGRPVICAGGGGIPVVRSVSATGHVTSGGVDAVIDKDRTAALLAMELKADQLVILTNVEGVISGWGTGDAKVMDVANARTLGAETFDSGTMGPKIEAALSFVEATGKSAAIGHLAAAEDVLAGRAGTLITA